MIRVARTALERERGLGGLAYLSPDDGMLFPFAMPTTNPFWNKDTFVALDIAFLDARGRILEIQPLRSLAESHGRLEQTVPAWPYTYALEMPRGWFAWRRLAPGDEINIPRIFADGTT